MAVSVDDPYSVDDGIYRTMFDPSTQNPCAAVVEALDTAAPSSELPVLADSIDPDTLTQLYRDDGNDSWMLNFDHGEIEVTLWGTGRIHVDATEVADTGSPSRPPVGYRLD